MAKKSSPGALVAVDEIQQKVHVVRGQRVMLDFDLARLYGVPAMRLKAQVRRKWSARRCWPATCFSPAKAPSPIFRDLATPSATGVASYNFFNGLLVRVVIE